MVLVCFSGILFWVYGLVVVVFVNLYYGFRYVIRLLYSDMRV